MGEVQRPLLVLMGAVAFVLLITCVNVARRCCSRAPPRGSASWPCARRSARGAAASCASCSPRAWCSRCIGGAFGVALAYAGVARARRVRRGGAAARGRRSASTAAVLAVRVRRLDGWPACSSACSPRCGRRRATCRTCCAPARAARWAARASGSAARSWWPRWRWRSVLVVGAGLAAKSFSRLLDVDPGFNPENVLAVRAGHARTTVRGRRAPAYYESLLERIAAVPGVRGGGRGEELPAARHGRGALAGDRAGQRGRRGGARAARAGDARERGLLQGDGDPAACGPRVRVRRTARTRRRCGS